MIKNAVVATCKTHAIVSCAVTQAHAHKADDHVFTGKPDGSAFDCNSFTRSCLPSNRHIVLIADQTTFELYYACDFEHDGSWTDICCTRFAQTAGAIVVQICYVHDFSATATDRVTTIALGSFKR